MRASNDSATAPRLSRYAREQSDSTRPTCSIDGCSKKVQARGWCTSHYRNARLYGSPTQTHSRHDPDAIRARRDAFFWANVDTSGGADACWMWQRKPADSGYGQMRGYTGQIHVHRFAYELLVGPIPDGLQLDHTCHDPRTCKLKRKCPHRACCNPAHLEPVTGVVNRSRGDTSRPRNGGGH